MWGLRVCRKWAPRLERDRMGGGVYAILIPHSLHWGILTLESFQECDDSAEPGFLNAKTKKSMKVHLVRQVRENSWRNGGIV